MPNLEIAEHSLGKNKTWGLMLKCCPLNCLCYGGLTCVQHLEHIKGSSRSVMGKSTLGFCKPVNFDWMTLAQGGAVTPYACCDISRQDIELECEHVFLH